MQGEYITHRLMPRIVRDIAKKQGITCTSLSDDWVIRLQKGARSKWIVGYSFDINSAGAVQVSSDKVAAYEVMHATHIPCIEHILVRSRAVDHFLDANIQAIDTNAPYVIKPLAMSGGIGVKLCGSLSDAKSHVMSQPTGTDWALSPYYKIAHEFRYCLLGGDILLCYEKAQPSYKDTLAMFNLSQGAVAIVTQPDPVHVKIAQAAQLACGLMLCAVDVAVLADGNIKVMEVNSGFMMEHFARQSDEYYQMTYEMYEKIITTMMA